MQQLTVGSMEDAVDRVMASYESLAALERFGREEIRVKVGEYLAKLSSAGHSDAEELTYYGLAYLRILHEGPDPVARQSGWEHSDNQDGHFGGRGERIFVAARR